MKGCWFIQSNLDFSQRMGERVLKVWIDKNSKDQSGMPKTPNDANM